MAGCTTLAAGTLVAATLGAAAAASRGRLVVHEWGTFLAMNGSDGVTLDGMYHEEHALPGFVHARSRDELRLPTSNLKGETPVIYFYSDQATRVRVEVGFPRGLWTQWYPQADFVGPSFVQSGSLLHPRGGRIGWTVDVVPPAPPHPVLPSATTDALWNYTRDVDAAFVSTGGTAVARSAPREWERFIFYRGLGEAPLPLTVSVADGARLTCGPELTGGLQHLFLLRVEGGRGAYRYLPSLRCGGAIPDVVPAMHGAQPIDTFAARLTDDLTARLVASGLYEKEARAMANTWRTSYFMADGVRVLFVLPQSWTNRFIPMTISPAPDELVRVMVGRIELLTTERERAAERAIASLASPDAAVRAAAFATLREQGRYVEPLVRRTLAASTDERVRALCRRLLLTDFVTGIRSSLTSAVDGRPLLQEPVFARAQLASLLRDMGLDAEAKQEAALALVGLEAMAPPRMEDHAARDRFRAWARAQEGAGRDAEALEWYGQFVEFGSRFRSCSGCHTLAGPRDVTFFRDWWAGRRFADLALKTGAAARLIASDEATLARMPENLLAQIRLAYLYEARGDQKRAAALWSVVTSGRAQAVVSR
jgi:hypothetical protein